MLNSPVVGGHEQQKSYLLKADGFVTREYIRTGLENLIVLAHLRTTSMTDVIVLTTCVITLCKPGASSHGQMKSPHDKD